MTVKGAGVGVDLICAAIDISDASMSAASPGCRGVAGFLPPNHVRHGDVAA